MNQGTEKASPDKQKYTPPEISDWGTISDLTKVGITNPGGDTKGGSVFPGGLEP